MREKVLWLAATVLLISGVAYLAAHKEDKLKRTPPDTMVAAKAPQHQPPPKPVVVAAPALTGAEEISLVDLDAAKVKSLLEEKSGNH